MPKKENNLVTVDPLKFWGRHYEALADIQGWCLSNCDGEIMLLKIDDKAIQMVTENAAKGDIMSLTALYLDGRKVDSTVDLPPFLVPIKDLSSPYFSSSNVFEQREEYAYFFFANIGEIKHTLVSRSQFKASSKVEEALECDVRYNDGRNRTRKTEKLVIKFYPTTAEIMYAMLGQRMIFKSAEFAKEDGPIK